MSAPLSIAREEPTAVRVLHIGCGRKGKDVPFVPEPLGSIVTLDADPFLKPDIVCRLGTDSIAMPDNSIDVIVAVHVLEHIGRQGETAEWFYAFEEFYRVLAPSGELRFESPLYDSVWAWADPSHTRALSPQAFVYFSQDHYRVPGSRISPYRIRCDFLSPEPMTGIPDSNPEVQAAEGYSHFRGRLQVRKPLRCWWED